MQGKAELYQKSAQKNRALFDFFVRFIDRAWFKVGASEERGV